MVPPKPDKQEQLCKKCNHKEEKHVGKTKYCIHIGKDNKMCSCAFFR